MIRREEARLRSLIRRLLVLSAAVAPAACSSTQATNADGGGASTDATVGGGSDSASGTDASQGSGPDGGGTDSSTGGQVDSAAPDATDPYGFLDAACDPTYTDGPNDGSGCDFYESLPCGVPPGSATEGCFLTIAQCGTLCNQVPTLQRVCAISECLAVDASTIPEAGPYTLNCATALPGCQPGVGRRPSGLARARVKRQRDAVGTTLAEMAHLEAASVHAFRRLEAELTALGAPGSLVATARRSARDEVRHARVTSQLARRRGCAPSRVVVSPAPQRRSLDDFAVENAVEGCVRESFGALVATHQAEHARDPGVKRAMRTIARDETRHAALAWAVARWLAPQLDARGRARVRRSIARAVESLRCEITMTPVEVAGELGLPAGAEGVRLLDAFAAASFGHSATGAG
jgi:hypothetical protein